MPASPGQFVNLVVFKSDGLSQIEGALNRTRLTQKELNDLTDRYAVALNKVKSVDFRDRVRETDMLMRRQERLTREMERQARIARMFTARGVASGLSQAATFGLGAAGVGATAALGMGIAGLQGTVPMARFRNQWDRLQWEIGNLLTPYLQFATRQTGRAANWLSRQDQGTQNMLGNAIMGGVGLAGANFLSNRMLGVGIGTAAVRGTSTAYRGAQIGLRSARLGLLGAAAAANLGYGMGGIRGALSAVAPTNPWAMGALAATFAFNPAIAGYNVDQLYKAQKPGMAGLEKFGDEYMARFGNLQGKDRTAAINAEIAKQLQNERAGITQMQGKKTRPVASAIDMLLGNMGDTSQAIESENRMKILRSLREGKAVPTTKHRFNQLVGGDYGEIGSTFYAAAQEFGRSGYGTGEAEGKATETGNPVVDVLNKILEKMPDKPNAAGQPDPNLAHAIPNFG